MVPRPERPEQYNFKNAGLDQVERDLGIETYHRHSSGLKQELIGAHLATLATAAAMNGIEWDISERRGKSRLRAVRHSKDGKDINPGSTNWDHLSGSSITESGVTVRGEIKSGRVWFGSTSVFPPAIDRSIAKLPYDERLRSSEVGLEIPSEHYGTPASRVGILAVHAPTDASKTISVSVISETANHEEFALLLNMLRPTPDYLQDEPRASTNSTLATNITANPATHFEFYDQLGVSPRTLRLSMQNAEVLEAYMDLA